MLHIPEELFVTRSVHRTLGLDPNNSILSCGFIHHTRHLTENENLVFKYYGALLLLSGEGTYIDSDGKSTRIYPGCFIQRIPYVKHSTITKEDGKWLEFFVCFGYETYRSLKHMGLLQDQPVLCPGLSQSLLDRCLLFYDHLEGAATEQLPYLLLEAQQLVLAYMTDIKSRVCTHRCVHFYMRRESCLAAAGSRMTAAAERQNIWGLDMRISANFSGRNFRCRPIPTSSRSG